MDFLVGLFLEGSTCHQGKGFPPHLLFLNLIKAVFRTFFPGVPFERGRPVPLWRHSGHPRTGLLPRSPKALKLFLFLLGCGRSAIPAAGGSFHTSVVKSIRAAVPLSKKSKPDERSHFTGTPFCRFFPPLIAHASASSFTRYHFQVRNSRIVFVASASRSPHRHLLCTEGVAGSSPCRPLGNFGFFWFLLDLMAAGSSSPTLAGHLSLQIRPYLASGFFSSCPFPATSPLKGRSVAWDF